MIKEKYKIDYLSITILNAILERNKQNKNNINCIISSRSGRKSTVCQLKFFEEWKQQDFKPIFALIRRKTDEPITEHWFSDYARQEIEKEGFDIGAEQLDRYIISIYMVKDGKKYIFGYGLYLSVSQKYKSNSYKGFDSIEYILLEEAIPQIQGNWQGLINRSNLEQDILDLLSIGSTICRYKKPCYILIGNDNKGQIVNPTTLSLDLLDKIELDTIFIYNKNINDKKYSVLFYYFTAGDECPHWLESNPDNVEPELTADMQYSYIQVISNDITYHLYNNDKFSYISNLLLPDIKKVSCTEDLYYQSLFGGALYNHYKAIKENAPISVYNSFIERLRFMNVFDNFFNYYIIVDSDDNTANYTYKWIYKSPEAKAPKIIDLDYILNAGDSYILTQVYDDISELCSIISNNLIYSNYHIKIVLHQLFQRFTMLKY